MVRRRIAELDRDIFARGELVRYARSGTDGGKREDRELAVANYMAEMEELEEEAEQLRYLVALHERIQQEERQRTRATWPLSWQVALVIFVAFVMFLFSLAVLRL